MAALITYSDVQTNCPLFGDGVEKTQKITLGIQRAEDKLKGILCDDTYNALVTANDTSTFPAGYQGLYNIAVKFLSWEAFIFYLKYSQVTDTDAGLRVFQENNSQAADPNIVQGHIRNAEQDSGQYLAEMYRYLEDNLTDFSDYKDSDCRKCQDQYSYTGKISGAASKKVKAPRTYTKPY